jgi:hypothetical protein
MTPKQDSSKTPAMQPHWLRLSDSRSHTMPIIKKDNTMTALQATRHTVYQTALAASLLAPATASTTAAVPEAITTVQSSAGNLQKLANTQWESDCGTGNPIESGLLFVFSGVEFGTVIGTSLPGTVTMGGYPDTGCRSQNPAQQRLTAVTISYIQELAVKSGALPAVQGTADQLLITTVETGATQTFAMGFLPGYKRFLGGRDGSVNATSVGYSRY